jgi:Protein of unknown function (DUF2800)
MKLLRASETYIYENCDASYGLMQQAGQEPTSVFADKGTRIHRVLAASQEITPGDLTSEESKIFEDLFAGLRRQLEVWRQGQQIERSWIEQEFVWRISGDVHYVGHPDKVLKSGDRLFIPDFKTSWQPLDGISATNAQLRAYVAIVDTNIEDDIREATVWIDKPGRKDAPALYDREAIQQAKIVLRNTAMRVTGKGEKIPNRGPWCTYCSGKVICPAWREEIHKFAANVESIDSLPDQQLAELAPKLDIAAKVIERLKARLEERVKANPEYFADWRFKPGRAVANIESVSKAWLAMKAEIDAESFLELTKLHIGKLTEAYRALHKCTWEEARKAIENKLGDNLKYARAKAQLVYDPQARVISIVNNGT